MLINPLRTTYLKMTLVVTIPIIDIYLRTVFSQ
jgi:hypothetical protein